MIPNKTKDTEEYIFHLGLNKAGTTSLNQALNELGIKSCHFTDPLINEGNPISFLFKDEIQNDSLDLKKYPFKAYTDIAIFSKKFKWLHDSYPNAKFILTIRDKEEWLKSRIAHYIKCTGPNNINDLDMEKYKNNSIDLYDTRISAITNFFLDKKDKLLIMDICNGDGYDKLCAFLNLPKQKENKFPRLNERRDNKEIKI